MILRTVEGWLRRAYGRLRRRRFQRRVTARVKEVEPHPTRPSEGPFIIVFAPEGDFGPAHVAQAVVARTLSEQGEQVLFVRCFSVFQRCPVMDLHGLQYGQTVATRRDTCIGCAAAAFTTIDGYGLRALDLRAFVTPDLTRVVADAIASAPTDLGTFEFDGVQFGKLCASDVCLAKKISDLSHPDPDVRLAWLDYIAGALTSYLLVSRMCRVLPVSHLVHFNDYSLMLGARVAAELAGARAVGLTLASHKNIDRRRYVFLDRPWRAVARRQGELWSRWRDLALPPAVVREIAEDSLLRFGGAGSHVYSPAKTFADSNIRTRLGLSMDKKLIVAFTSSEDEVAASTMYLDALGYPSMETRQPFASQIEWLRALVSYVERHDELQLVVRIHPREGANRRESVESQHLGKLRKAFTGDHGRCRFVWPGEAVSSYDLGESADLALVSWSSLGQELARLGVPVLASTTAVATVPHGDFLEFRSTEAEYFVELERLLESRAFLHRIGYAYRWYNLYYIGASVDLSDLVPRSDFAPLPPYAVLREAATIRRIVVEGVDPLTVNFARLRENQAGQAAELERAALRAELRRIVHFLCTGEQVESAEFRVFSGPRPASTTATASGGAGLLVLNGAYVSYHAGGSVFERFSPMISRLAPLCGEPVADAAGPGRLAAAAAGAL